MELRRYAAIILGRWWLIGLATLLAAGLSWYISQSLPRIYRASTILLINQAQDDRGLDYNSLLLSERLARTYADLIRQPPVLAATIEKLRLPTDARRLADQIEVKVLPNTQLLQIAVEDQNPARARDVANTVAEIFISQRASDQLGSSALSRTVLQSQIRALETEIRQTSDALDQARRASGPDSAEVMRLQSLLSQRQATYSQLVQSEVQMALAEARASHAIKVAVPAEVPTEPVRPKVLLNTALAGALGLLLAVGVVFLLEYLDDTVKSDLDVRSTCQLPTLATVPRAGGRSPLGPWPVTDAMARAPLVEAYRVLRINLDFAWAGQRGQVVMVSSANPGDGKTTTAANLGVVLAHDGRRVVLVDADLRHPTLHRAFDLPNDRGLTHLLAEPGTTVSRYLVATQHPNLQLLPSGPIPPNPAELLGSRGFAQVLGELRQLADVILIDTPPLLAVADPAVVSQQVDGVVVVAESAGTRREALARAAEVLSRSAIRTLGVVLNKVDGHSAEYAYYYYRSGTSQVNGANGRSDQQASPGRWRSEKARAQPAPEG